MFKQFLTNYQLYLNYIKYKLNENINSQLLFNFKYNRKYYHYDIFRSSSYNKHINLYENYIINKYGPKNLNWNYYNFINESLIKTYEYDKLINKILSLLIDYKNNVDYQYDCNNFQNSNTKIIQFIFLEDVYNKIENKLNNIINFYGFFISQLIKEDNNVYIQIEPKYIEEATDFIYNNCKGILYHITIENLYNKIKNNGLIPKSLNKKSYHPERIYFYFSENNISLQQFKIQANNLFKNYKGYFLPYLNNYIIDNKLNVLILKIDLNKYKQLTYLNNRESEKLHYRFFYDPNHPQAVFTYDSIHPACVDILYEFQI